MSTHPRINLKILLLVTAVMFTTVGLSGTALNAATFDASMSARLTLTGITLPGVIGPSPLNLSGIDFAGSLDLPGSNTVTGPASIDGTSVSYTINGTEVSTGFTGTGVSFGSTAGFSIGDYFSLKSEAFTTSDTTDIATAVAGAIGTLDLTSTSTFDYEVSFNLTWSMSAATTDSTGITSVAETFIYADIIGGETTDGRTILADMLGRSVSGVGDFTDVTVSTDFRLLLAAGASSSIEVLFSEALGFIDPLGEDIPVPVNPVVNPVPVPATLWLFGSALVGLVGLRQRIMKNG